MGSNLAQAFQEAGHIAATEKVVRESVRNANRNWRKQTGNGGGKPKNSNPPYFNWKCGWEEDAAAKAAHRCGNFAKKLRDLDLSGILKIEPPSARYYPRPRALT
ncbi:hypothetical protein L0Y69_01190 [bacterium]|nr:hypothetical protein [bacterium]